METEVIISTGGAKYFKKLKDKKLKDKFAEAIKKIKENEGWEYLKTTYVNTLCSLSFLLFFYSSSFKNSLC